jgi:malonyl-CoA decarboxylase
VNLPPPKVGAPARRMSRSVRKALALCHVLESERGELSATRLAAEVLSLYKGFDLAGQREFFAALMEDFSPSPKEIVSAAADYAEQPTAKNLAVLQKAVEPPRRELFRRLNMAPGATVELVQMRRQLLGQLKANPEWEPMSEDLAYLFTSWFNRGFLELRRIDWRTSAFVLEKLIEYEAVHAVQGWDDLRRRLASDRRCYAFFHPAMPDEPVVFIEVALTRGMAAAVQPLLDPASAVFDSQQADSAIFYSITNCQDGLRGVAFGNLLIKQVVEDLQNEFPRLRKFATLSPIPGFRDWLKTNRAWIERDGRYEGLFASLEYPLWPNDAAHARRLEEQLIPLCAHYLVLARAKGKPVDSVARFHLRNGARLERINWMGDTSVTGMRRSAGLMVNYVYRLEELERNHEAYRHEGKVSASYDIDAMARKGEPATGA